MAQMTAGEEKKKEAIRFSELPPLSEMKPEKGIAPGQKEVRAAVELLKEFAGKSQVIDDIVKHPEKYNFKMV